MVREYVSTYSSFLCMEHKWKIKYEKLQQELSVIMANGFPTENKIVQCFQLCNKYLTEINASSEGKAGNFGFRKNISPYFMAEVEFFNHLAFAFLFCPKDECEERRLFIVREKSRFIKFRNQHREFIVYHQSGSMDEGVFYKLDNLHKYETIVSGYLALEKYISFLGNSG